MKRFLSLLLVIILFSGCSSSQEIEEHPDPNQVVLRYYTIGREDQDLRMVNDQLNEILNSRYGFSVDYRKIDFNEYENVTNTIINTDQQFDVMFTWDSHYARNAAQGVFLNLDPYLAEECCNLYHAVDPRLWQGVKVRGKICGVPTNKELAPVVQFLFSEQLVDKYNIRTANFRTLQSLEPLLAMIKRDEPEVTPLVFTSDRVNLAELIGYEYVAGGNLPFAVKQGSKDCKVVNLYETEEMKDLMATLRHYYKTGYINDDAALRTAVSHFPGENVFCRIGVGGPESAQSFSVDFGYPIVTKDASTPWVTNSSARGGIMAVNAKSTHVEEALAFLTAVNLDPDVRNLLNYGVEGVHYNLTESGQIHLLSDGYRGIRYSQGNWFILKTMEGEEPDKWKNYSVYNQQAQSSRLLGFEPDLRKLEQESIQVSEVYLRYDNPLLTGSVDPQVYREKALQQMNLCGAETIQNELQKQVNSWLGVS